MQELCAASTKSTSSPLWASAYMCRDDSDSNSGRVQRGNGFADDDQSSTTDGFSDGHSYRGLRSVPSIAFTTAKGFAALGYACSSNRGCGHCCPAYADRCFTTHSNPFINGGAAHSISDATDSLPNSASK